MTESVAVAANQFLNSTAGSENAHSSFDFHGGCYSDKPDEQSCFHKEKIFPCHLMCRSSSIDDVGCHSYDAILEDQCQITNKSPPSPDGKAQDSAGPGPSFNGDGEEVTLVLFNQSAFRNLGDSLRIIFSDPISGALMHEAFIFPCGHSFGAAGIAHAMKMKICFTCSAPVPEDAILPNLALQLAVEAFCREEDRGFFHKRKRDRSDQDKNVKGDITFSDSPRGRGVQFPFAVTDRVIIKGNKRTPERFIGQEAVVTTQCLNGWYVVKTLETAESVKLQYRSLAKVSDEVSSKHMPPLWH